MLTTGLPNDQYVFVVRQDPREPRVLLAGTRTTVYVSLDGGARWQPLSLNLPGVQVRDLAIDGRQGDVAVATHGRAFWILDNLALIEQLARNGGGDATTAQLFAPEMLDKVFDKFGVARDQAPHWISSPLHQPLRCPQI